MIDLIATDVMFPEYRYGMDTDEYLRENNNYLFLLREDLKYALRNLGIANFNSRQLEVLSDRITSPVYIKIDDVEKGLSTAISITAGQLTSFMQEADGKFTALEQTTGAISATVYDPDTGLAAVRLVAEGLTTTVASLSGDVATLQLTAQGLNTRVSDAEGDIAELALTAQGLNTRVTDAEGDISTLTQTATGLETRVSTAEGNISTVSQTANKINWLVASGTSASNFTMTDRAIQLVADSIDLTGFVTFTDLSTTGRTTISGDNITTGTIQASCINLSEYSKTTQIQNSISSAINGLTLSVTNGTDSSTLKLLSGSTELASKQIKFTGDVIFASDLVDGTTRISGSNIKTGVINADLITAGSMSAARITSGEMSADRVRLYNKMEVYNGSTGTNIGGYVGYATSNINGDSAIGVFSKTAGKGESVASDLGAHISYGYFGGTGTASETQDSAQAYASQGKAGLTAKEISLTSSWSGGGINLNSYGGIFLTSSAASVDVGTSAAEAKVVLHSGADTLGNQYGTVKTSSSGASVGYHIDAADSTSAQFYVENGAAVASAKSVSLLSEYENGYVRLRHRHGSGAGWSAYWLGGGSGVQFAPDTQYADLGVSASAGSTIDGVKVYRWNRVYANSVYNSGGEITSSDRDMKTDIDYNVDRYMPLLDALNPCSFKYIDGTSGRTHIGFIAQDLLSAMTDAGIDTQDFGGYVDDNGLLGIRYEQFIPLIIGRLHQLQARISALEGVSA